MPSSNAILRQAQDAKEIMLKNEIMVSLSNRDI
jgi:hypothetical protein